MASTSSTTTTTSTMTMSISPSTLKLMSELVSYPVLLEHEEALTKSGPSKHMYDVSSWMLYLSQVDELLEQLEHAIQATSNSKRNRGELRSDVMNIGGRSVTFQGMDVTSSVKELQKMVRRLQQARNLISERSLSLLPGSYKLWLDYLTFRSDSYTYLSSSRSRPSTSTSTSASTSAATDTTSAITSTNNTNHHCQRPSPATMARYNATISAYERSLVRMNKYPRIWLSYLSFLVHHEPNYNLTSIRRLFNRSLLALPATQHDLIWSEYLCFILGCSSKGQIPKGLMIQKNKGNGPIVTSVLNGRLEMIRGKENMWNSGIIPHETMIRVLTRYAHYYNPAARELLAKKLVECERYGDAALLYGELLNDVDFLSVEGTSRHELWMTFTSVCTEHPEQSRQAGIDFEQIVRAVLKPSSKTQHGHGWDVFDLEKDNNADANVDTGADTGAVPKEDPSVVKRNKVKEQQAQLQASLGEMEGTLWTKLAHYHIRSGEFEVARSIYEEAMESVSKVRDFTLIFDAYVKFEEGVIEAMMLMMDDEDGNEDGNVDDTKEDGGEQNITTPNEDVDEEDLDILLGDAARKSNNDDDDIQGEENVSADIELSIARAENLMSRRTLLLNYVLLRQNPHNVGEWLKRSELYMDMNQPSQAVASLEESVKLVHARQAMNGTPAELWMALASFHEKRKDVTKVRTVYERICCSSPEYRFRESEDLAQCYAAWVEMELREENWDGALSVARRSIAQPSPGSSKVVRGLVRSMRLWNLLLDLEESLGTLQTTKDAYNRLLELKLATPAQVLNFATFLSEKKYFEESFTAYERGLDMFPFPHAGAKTLWKDYLQAFQKRYSGTKIHRLRELFDRCLDSCPAEDSVEFFLMYGKVEEAYGLTKRALGVYEKMCTSVPSQDKYAAYQLYITKTTQFIGVTAVRPIYERAISALEDSPASKICCEYAKMEASLQEIDRARTAFTYGAQLADPRRNPEYWGEWHEFEISHGNEETFREMLRVKRGVQAAFSTVNYNAAEMGATPKVDTPLTDEQAVAMLAAQEGVEVAENESKISGFVQAKRPAEIKDLDEVERRAAKLRKVKATLITPGEDVQDTNNADDEEIDIEDEDDDEEVDDDDSAGVITTKAVPTAVFGSLVSS